MKKKMLNRCISILMIMSMLLFLCNDLSVAQAAAAKSAPKISTTSVKVNVKGSKKVVVKNKPKNAKVTWKSKNVKIAKVSKSGKITGVKAGKTTVTAKVKYKKNKKNVTKTFKIKVTVSEKSTATAPVEETTAVQPTAVPTAAPTETPAANVIEANVNEKGTAQDSNLTEEHKSRNGLTTKDNGVMRTNLSTQDIVAAMGLGWNIGNSLEQVSAASCEKLTAEEQAALTDAQWVKGYETNAGNPASTQKLFDGLKKYGINTIRIPIAWSNMMVAEKQDDGSTFYKINDAYFDRVEEIINYCLNDEMYVIINIHWDNGWWGMFGDRDEAIRQQALKRYEDFWTQISNRYMEYSDRLIFEGANEELGERLNDNWKGGSNQFSFSAYEPGQDQYGTLTKQECYETVEKLNQKFVDIVRNSGGNNKYRFLLIPGFNTNIHDTCSADFHMPEDKDNDVNKLFVSIHYYDPIGWGIAKSASQGYQGYADTWGSEEDLTYMENDFKEAKAAFIDKGYTIIFGEFGVLSVNKDGIPDYFKKFFEYCLQDGMLPVMWDEGGYVDRKAKTNGGVAFFLYEDIGNVFTEVTNSPEVSLKSDAKKVLCVTGKPEDPVCENQDPLVVATWNGDFMRNTTTSQSVDLTKIEADYGSEFIQGEEGAQYGGYFHTDSIQINPNYPDLTLSARYVAGWWHSHFQLSDWSQLKQPCIRIQLNDDDISQQAQLQLVYSDDKSENDEMIASQSMEWKYETDFEQVVWTEGKDNNGKDFQVPLRDDDGNMVLAETAWIGKVLNLNKKYLESFPDVLITTNTFLGVDFKKIEICDAAYNADGTEFSK